MKKRILIILFAGLLIASSFSMSEAFSADSPFTNSFVEVIPSFNSFGDHAVITYESTDANGSFFAFLLDSSGVPVASSATFNWVYLFADIVSNGTLKIYGSDSGSSNDWHFIGNF